MPSRLPSAIHAAQHHSEGSAFVVVRVPKHDEVSLSTALDAGAAAIVIPHTESADDVKRFIKDMYYRKSGLSRPAPTLFFWRRGVGACLEFPLG